MGSTTSAYHFYGVHIPEDQWTEAYAGREGERLDSLIDQAELMSKTGVKLGYLTAGHYDDHMLFVAVRTDVIPWEVGLGGFRRNPSTQSVPVGWNKALGYLVSLAGYDLEEIDQPAWITVPSVD